MNVLVLWVACVATQNAVPVDVHGVLPMPKPTDGFVEVLRITVGDTARKLTVTEATLTAPGKPGDPQRLAIRSSQKPTQTLGYMTLSIRSNNRPAQYRLEKAVDLPDSSPLLLTAEAATNWARLVSRRKLSRGLHIALTDGHSNQPVPIQMRTHKREKGPDFTVEASLSIEEFLSGHPHLQPANDKQTVLLKAGTWEVANDWIVPRGVTLRIEPGATLRIHPGRSIFSYGRVIAEGTGQNPIVFDKAGISAWGSIALIGYGSRNSRFQFTRFQHGGQSWLGTRDVLGTLDALDTSVTLSTCVFEDIRGEDAVHIQGGEGHIRQTWFHRIASDAVDFDEATGTISDSVFQTIGDDAIDGGAAVLTVDTVSVLQSGGKAISAGSGTRLTLTNALLFQNGRGISSFDGSSVEADRIAVAHAMRGGLQAMSRRGERAGNIAVTNSLFWKNKGGDETHKDATLTRENCRSDVAVTVDNASATLGDGKEDIGNRSAPNRLAFWNQETTASPQTVLLIPPPVVEAVEVATTPAPTKQSNKFLALLMLSILILLAGIVWWNRRSASA